MAIKNIFFGAAGIGCLILLAGLGVALAQSSNPKAGPTLADLQMRLKHAQSETELEPKFKQQVVETYQSAIERMEIANESTTVAKSFLQRMNSVTADLIVARQKLAEMPEKPTLTVPAEADIEAIEADLGERRKVIEEPDTGLRALADQAKKQLASRKSRLELIAGELNEIEERLTAIQASMDEAPPDHEPRELSMARQTLLLVRRMRANEERTALRAEQTWCESDDVDQLLKVNRDLAVKHLALAEAEVGLLQDEVDKRRGSEADQRVRAFALIVQNAAPQVRPIAERNLKIAEESRDLTLALHDTNERVEATRERFNTLTAEFDQSKKMVEAVGLTESIGLLLRQQRAKLSDTRGLHSRLALRGETVRQTRMKIFQIEGELAALQDLDTASRKVANDLLNEESSTPATASNLETPAVKKLAVELRPLLEQRRDLLEHLESDSNKHFETLVSLDNQERKLLEATERYADYVDERVLWIRTGGVFGSVQTTRAVSNTAWLLDEANWWKVADAIQMNVNREPLPYVIAAIGFLIWVGTRWSLRRRLQLAGLGADDPSCRELLPTVQAIGLSLLLAGFIPAVLAFLSWRLDHCASTSRFVHAVALGLRRAAIFAWPLELLRLIVVRGGLAHKHFDWSPEAITRLRRHLSWFIPVGIILVAIIGMVEATADDQRLDSLGRMNYLVFGGLLLFFCQRAFPRGSKAATVAVEQSSNSRNDVPSEEDVWMNRLGRLGGLLSILLPAGLLILCWSGYFYTALQLTWRLQSSCCLLMSLVLLRGAVRRWITLERRRMAVLQQEEMDAIVGAEKHPGSESHSPFLFPRWTWPDFRMNLSQIVTQVRSLLDTGLLTIAAIGLWFVWADVTPALNILDRVTLWKTTVEEVVETKGADDKPVVQVVRRPAPITAANLGIALLIVAIATIAGRNIPGLIEVILLEHLQVDAGIRFATTCLVRYVIFTAGVIFAFNQIGIGWNSVQWLVAAASVGLGFGLQEIFANFVSGIILLFERPMRVGDVITIESTTGTVSRIRFRATTIVDGDRKELIVPNKSFITGNLLNWTLSDSINRVAVKVGVAYGSNPNLVRELLLQIASEHPVLLKDPAPTAVLEELGESALNFQLRAFLPTLKDRQKTMHELNTMIHERFRAAGIEIPFPQQDIHIRTQPSDSDAADLQKSLPEALSRAGIKVE